MTHTPPVLRQSSADSIRIVAEIPVASPDTIFDYWTKRELLKKWWPPEAELNLRTGGDYHYWWPKQNWHLRGHFTELAMGETLAFTWKWDHESVDQTNVDLTLEPLSGKGTRLTLQHTGHSDDPEGRKIRDEHFDGWMYFLEKLQNLWEQSLASK